MKRIDIKGNHYHVMVYFWLFEQARIPFSHRMEAILKGVKEEDEFG